MHTCPHRDVIQTLHERTQPCGTNGMAPQLCVGPCMCAYMCTVAYACVCTHVHVCMRTWSMRGHPYVLCARMHTHRYAYAQHLCRTYSGAHIQTHRTRAHLSTHARAEEAHCAYLCTYMCVRACTLRALSSRRVSDLESQRSYFNRNIADATSCHITIC